MSKVAELTDTMKAALAKLARDGYAFAGVSTFKALERRGLVTANTAPRDPAKGVWCHYRLTDAGREVAAQESTEDAACGNRWKYGKGACAREVSHIGPHRNTEALEAWSFHWFDNEGTPAEQPAENAENEESATATDESSTTVSPAAAITDWKTTITSVCPCGHGHRFADNCTVEACDCGGYRPSGIDLIFSPSAQVWGLRKGSEVTVLPLDRPRRTSRQARVAAIRSAAAS